MHRNLCTARNIRSHIRIDFWNRSEGFERIKKLWSDWSCYFLQSVGVLIQFFDGDIGIRKNFWPNFQVKARPSVRKIQQHIDEVVGQALGRFIFGQGVKRMCCSDDREKLTSVGSFFFFSSFRSLRNEVRNDSSAGTITDIVPDHVRVNGFPPK